MSDSDIAPAGPDPPFIQDAYSQLGERSGSLALQVGPIAGLWVRLHLLQMQRVILRWRRDGNGEAAEKDLKALRMGQELERKKEIEERLQYLREEVSKLEKEVDPQQDLLRPAGLPKLTPEEEVVLCATLVRLGFLQPGQDLPAPDDSFTGVAGKSRVFLFFLGTLGGGTRLIAKFDRADRAKDEGRATRPLRLYDAFPPEIILPHGGNEVEDGVLIYPVAGTRQLKKFVSLAQFVAANLEHAPDSCADCLKLFLEPLRYFYNIEPGQVRDRDARDKLLEWKRFFPRVPGSDELLALAECDCRELDWKEPLLKPHDANASRAHPLTGRRNPLHGVGERLDKRTGSLRLSRVHGDLNLTNILVCPAPDGTPLRAYLIDLADSQGSQATASDLARFETQFWVDRYQQLEQKNLVAGADWLADFAAGCDYLTGRTAQLAQLGSPLAKQALSFVYHFRRHVAEILGPDTPPPYLLGDYFHCLLFGYLTLLSYEGIRKRPPLVQLALVGAASAWETICDQEGGRYNPKARRPLLSPCRELPDLEHFD